MRRPVGVKLVFFLFPGTRFSLRRVATVATLPSALFSERFSLGASWAFSFQPVLPPVSRPWFPFFRNGSWARHSTQAPELGVLGDVSLLPRMFLSYAAVAAIGLRLWSAWSLRASVTARRTVSLGAVVSPVATCALIAAETSRALVSLSELRAASRSKSVWSKASLTEIVLIAVLLQGSFSLCT